LVQANVPSSEFEQLNTVHLGNVVLPRARRNSSCDLGVERGLPVGDTAGFFGGQLLLLGSQP
jgi:hypothetical protein